MRERAARDVAFRRGVTVLVSRGVTRDVVRLEGAERAGGRRRDAQSARRAAVRPAVRARARPAGRARARQAAAGDVARTVGVTVMVVVRVTVTVTVTPDGDGDFGDGRIPELRGGRGAATDRRQTTDDR
jgi:hypothetical protein